MQESCRRPDPWADIITPLILNKDTNRMGIFKTLGPIFLLLRGRLQGQVLKGEGQHSVDPLGLRTKSTDQIQFFGKLLLMVILSGFEAVLQASVLLLATPLVCLLEVFRATELHRVNLQCFLKGKHRYNIGPRCVF